MKTLSSHNTTENPIRKQIRLELRDQVMSQVQVHIINQASNPLWTHIILGGLVQFQVHSKVIAWKKYQDYKI